MLEKVKGWWNLDTSGSTAKGMKERNRERTRERERGEVEMVWPPEAAVDTASLYEEGSVATEFPWNLHFLSKRETFFLQLYT